MWIDRVIEKIKRVQFIASEDDDDDDDVGVGIQETTKDIIVRMELPQQLRTSLTLLLYCAARTSFRFFVFVYFVRCPSSHFDIAPS